MDLSKADSKDDKIGLQQPVLVSFPQNIPPSKQLSKMKFNLYEEDKQTQSQSMRVRKRVLKSAYKTLKYEASSLHADIKQRTQTSDYYIGVFDSAKNKCYALPIDAAYQMSQTIDGFQAKTLILQKQKTKWSVVRTRRASCQSFRSPLKKQ